MNMDKITMLMGHPDDEFLFGFPVIHRAKKIIACVDDMTHPTRQWCRRRKEAFFDVCKLVGAEGVVLRYDSGFAKLDVGSGALNKFVEDVREEIKDADTIFTHNAWGEYGHIDHIFLNSLARQSGKPIVTTDIVLRADWYQAKEFNQGKSIERVMNDYQFHDKCVEIYRHYEAFGWPYMPVDSALLIEVQS